MSSIAALHPMDAGTTAPTVTTNSSGASGTSGTSSTNTSAPNNQLTGNSFIQLLTAQLQAQDPLNPIDPTTFVTQLVQFNQLQQLIDINQTLTTPVSTPSSTGSGSQANNNLTSAV